MMFNRRIGAPIIFGTVNWHNRRGAMLASGKTKPQGRNASVRTNEIVRIEKGVFRAPKRGG